MGRAQYTTLASTAEIYQTLEEWLLGAKMGLTLKRTATSTPPEKYPTGILVHGHPQATPVSPLDQMSQKPEP